jgi:hypothetical protein
LDLALQIMKNLSDLPSTGFQEVISAIFDVFKRAVSFEPYELSIPSDSIKNPILRQRLKMSEPILYVEFFNHILSEVALLNGKIESLQQELVLKIQSMHDTLN